MSQYGGVLRQNLEKIFCLDNLEVLLQWSETSFLIHKDDLYSLLLLAHQLRMEKQLFGKRKDTKQL